MTSAFVLRYAAYGAVLSTLYEIDPEAAGVDCKDLVGLYQYLLSADPTGIEGRPGSADAVIAMHRPGFSNGPGDVKSPVRQTPSSASVDGHDSSHFVD